MADRGGEPPWSGIPRVVSQDHLYHPPISRSKQSSPTRTAPPAQYWARQKAQGDRLEALTRRPSWLIPRCARRPASRRRGAGEAGWRLQGRSTLPRSRGLPRAVPSPCCPLRLAWSAAAGRPCSRLTLQPDAASGRRLAASPGRRRGVQGRPPALCSCAPRSPVAQWIRPCGRRWLSGLHPRGRRPTL